MKTYEQIKTDFISVLKATLLNGQEIWIPLDPANSDYQEYLAYTAWVEAGNKPDEFWTQGVN